MPAAIFKIQNLVLVAACLLFSGCAGISSNQPPAPPSTTLTSKELVFTRSGQLIVAQSDSGQETVLVNSGTASLPAWLPNTPEVIYCAHNGAYHEFRKFNLITKSDDLIGATKAAPRYLANSASGQALLYLVDDTLNILDLTTGRSSQIDQVVSYPSWSPDGQSFSYLNTGQELKISTNQKVRTIFSGPLQAITYYDAQYILALQPGEGEFKLLKIAVTGTESPQELATLEFSQITQAQLQLSPDQKILLSFISDPAALTRSVYLIDLSTGPVQLLTQGFDLAWDKGGQKIYFHLTKLDSDGNLTRNLYVQPLDKSEHKLLISQADNCVPYTRLSSNTPEF